MGGDISVTIKDAVECKGHITSAVSDKLLKFVRQKIKPDDSIVFDLIGERLSDDWSVERKSKVKTGLIPKHF